MRKIIRKANASLLLIAIAAQPMLLGSCAALKYLLPTNKGVSVDAQAGDRIIKGTAGNEQTIKTNNGRVVAGDAIEANAQQQTIINNLQNKLSWTERLIYFLVVVTWTMGWMLPPPWKLIKRWRRKKGGEV